MRQIGIYSIAARSVSLAAFLLSRAVAPWFSQVDRSSVHYSLGQSLIIDYIVQQLLEGPVKVSCVFSASLEVRNIIFSCKLIRFFLVDLNIVY